MKILQYIRRKILRYKKKLKNNKQKNAPGILLIGN